MNTSVVPNSMYPQYNLIPFEDQIAKFNTSSNCSIASPNSSVSLGKYGTSSAYVDQGVSTLQSFAQTVADRVVTTLFNSLRGASVFQNNGQAINTTPQPQTYSPFPNVSTSPAPSEQGWFDKAYSYVDSFISKASDIFDKVSPILSAIGSFSGIGGMATNIFKSVKGIFG
jgi:hypothetical protein